MDKMFKTILMFFLFTITASGVLFFALSFFAEPEQGYGFTTRDYLHIAQTISLSLAIITGTAASAVGYRSHRIRETDATNKRFNEAVRSMCHKDDMFIRIEGIYALERLAFNALNKEEQQRVMEVLCKRLQQERPYPLEKNNTYDQVPYEKDHDAIIQVIMRITRRFKNIHVDLSNTNLHHLEFKKLNLKNANFRNSNLSYASFHKVNLKNASFYTARIILVGFKYSNLKNANFNDAYIAHSGFDYSYLKGTLVDLKKVHIISCKFGRFKRKITVLHPDRPRFKGDDSD